MKSALVSLNKAGYLLNPYESFREIRTNHRGCHHLMTGACLRRGIENGSGRCLDPVNRREVLDPVGPRSDPVISGVRYGAPYKKALELMGFHWGYGFTPINGII